MLVTAGARHRIAQQNRYMDIRETQGIQAEFSYRFFEFVTIADASLTVVLPMATRGMTVGRALSRSISVLKMTRKSAEMEMSKGDHAEGMAELDLSVTYDPYTESILAEVMSSQQTESKLESAPRFIRPKKKKKLLNK